ncbi:beta-ketoacyl synthase chain length factor [Sphingobacterium hungaricum]|uniref:3-oxoacyl-ACP synthase n=1 Tax=Sphingobacterium hungaricum TaxID=2082723 RepID=A0A928YR98_9SPHI|nr:beta-ketoacyl synthase chain length factor [Sphingobacterium hungaricum]MBE8713895.1 3-oxoacyl-ACP synthase [Sphingobacterium hungaricum]
MKQKVYINGIGAVTAQGIWRKEIFDEAQEICSNTALAQQPGYKELIAPAMIRRMSKGIKMGIFASQQALDNAEISQPDAVITGTGLGCLEDSEKFLKAILANDEQFLTPTNFIQSTHNTVGAQIALRLACKGYNFTYVNGAVSFESAMLDALLQLESAESSAILLGGMDEIADHTVSLLKLIDYIKPDEVHETIKESTTKGVNTSEGAVFFGLSSDLNPHTKAEIADVEIKNLVEKSAISDWTNEFLERNHSTISDIDAVVLGVNGDVEFDSYYEEFASAFTEIPQLYYKHLSGEYDTASAFGLATAVKVLDEQVVPQIISWNTIQASKIKTILVYNQYRGRDHSLVLLHHVETP